MFPSSTPPLPNAARLGRMVLAAFVAATVLAFAPPAAGPAPVAAATRGWTCPVENRTTRPNNGGASISTFANRGYDISYWDAAAGVTVAAIRTKSPSFSFIKATQGTYLVDETYRKHALMARRLGITFGSYHFFDYRIDGKAQADYFVDAVLANNPGFGFAGQLPPVIDVECVPYGAPDHAASISRIRAFITEVQRRTGVKPIVYTSIFEWNTVTGGSAAFGDCPLWSAEWATTAPLKFPPGWTRWTFWQWGFEPVAAGLRKVDADAFNGTRAQLEALRLRH